MNATISDRVHGIIDYATVVVFFFAPTVLQLDGPPAITCYTLAGLHLLMSLVSAMPYGAVSIVSMRFHGIVELLLGLALVTAPWFAPSIFGGAELFFAVMGAAILVVWALSRYSQSFIEAARLDQSA